jgi:hypothetical protein
VNKFDKFLWRTVGVILLGFLGFGLFSLGWNFSGVRIYNPPAKSPPSIVNKPKGSQESEILHLEWPSRMSGTPFLMMPLKSEPRTGGSSFRGTGERAQIRNYLVINSSNLQSWWLFEGFDRAFLGRHDLREQLEGSDKTVTGVILEAATADTNGDQRITEEDKVAAFFIGPEARNPVEVVTASDRLVSIDQVTNDEVLIVYQRGSALTAALFSTHDGTKIKDSPLPTEKQ